MAIFLWCITLLLFFTSSCVHSQSTLSFCDGDNLFVINEPDCHGAINFGHRKPPCVCVSGVYRSWNEDCSLFDGFTENYCSIISTDDDLHGLRLISGLSNIYHDTAAVFGENGSDFTTWKTYGINSNGKTGSDTFYTVNGFPVMLRKQNDHFICVEASPKQEKQVCRYFATDNEDFWEPGSHVRILVQDKCKIGGYAIAELKAHRCYDVVNNTASECQLDCLSGKTLSIPGSVSTREKKSIKSTSAESMIPPERNFPAPNLIVPTNPSINNVNFFMHRKLNKYTRLRQTGQVENPDLSQAAPNRTMLLLSIAKQVVREFCPTNWVSDLFLDQALELFVVLHRGQDLRFIEDVPSRDFKWIQEILLDCKVRRVNLKETSENWHQENIYRPECAQDDFVGKYSYLMKDMHWPVDLDRGAHHHQGKFHFVIEAVWQMINMVHSLCQTEFQQKSYRMYHVWEQASEKLFTRDLRNLWFSPQVDLVVYNSLLTNRAVVDMVNLERCTQAAYFTSGMSELQRPEVIKSNFKRRKRDVFPESERISVASSVDVYCAKDNKDVDYNC